MKRTILVFSLVLGAYLPMSSAFAASVTEQLSQLWNYQQPAESEGRFRALLQQQDCTQAASDCLEIQTQIARAQGLQRQFDAAHATLNQVEQATAFATSPRAQVRYQLERGRVFNSAKAPDRAIAYFERALALAQQHQLDDWAVDAAHMLAIAVPLEQQEHWHLQAIALAEASADPKAQKWLGSLYNNLGWTYHDLKAYSKALALFEKNIPWHAKYGTPETLHIAKWSVARVLRSLERHTEALSLLQTLAQDDGYVCEEMAENLLVLEGAVRAQPHFAQAYALLSQDQWLQANESERLNRLKQLSMGSAPGQP